jgi:hypothetical protein
MRNVLGFVAGALILASAAAHAFVGWPAIHAEIAKTNAPAELVTGLAVAWQFSGAAMLAMGAIVLLQFSGARRQRDFSLRPAQVIAFVYLAFGIGALAVSWDRFLSGDAHDSR